MSPPAEYACQPYGCKRQRGTIQSTCAHRWEESAGPPSACPESYKDIVLAYLFEYSWHYLFSQPARMRVSVPMRACRQVSNGTAAALQSLRSAPAPSITPTRKSAPSITPVTRAPSYSSVGSRPSRAKNVTTLLWAPGGAKSVGATLQHHGPTRVRDDIRVTMARHTAAPAGGGDGDGGGGGGGSKEPKMALTARERMVQLNELLQEGMVTQAEFDAKRTAILDSL